MLVFIWGVLVDGYDRLLFWDVYETLVFMLKTYTLLYCIFFWDGICSVYDDEYGYMFIIVHTSFHGKILQYD